MQVSEVMHKGVSTVQIGDSIRKVAALMKREDVGAVPVYKNERLVGFVTDRDIVVSSVAQGQSADQPISLAMRSEVHVVHEQDDIQMATKLMREKQISRLLVVDKGERPVGMLSIQDLSRNLASEDFTSETLEGIKRN